MLTSLRIQNIALIDALEVEFSQGLNVLTGETGAGKSVIIGSIGIALGGKFDRELLRNPDKDGMVEVSFSLTKEEEDRIREADILPDDILDRELVITRKIRNTTQATLITIWKETIFWSSSIRRNTSRNRTIRAVAAAPWSTATTR